MKIPNNLKPLSPSRHHSRIKIFAVATAMLAPMTGLFAQTLWTGGVGAIDYNNASLWNPTGVPNGTVNCTDDAGSNNIILIQAGDPAFQHGDTLTGNGANTSGAWVQTGSTNYTGGGNWLRMGVGAGSYGSYILSNGVVNVGGRTQIGEQGTGYLEIDGGTYNGNVNDGGADPGLVCGQGDFGSGTGTFVFRGGTITILQETWFGEQNGSAIGTGYFNMSGGTYNANSWFVFGRNGATGIGVMTGGTINFTGGGQFLVGGGGVGSLTQSGGTINVQNQYLVPQSNGGGSGTGTNNLSGNAVLNLHDWVAVGRNSGYGELNISGNAAITRDNANDSGANFDVGGGGPGVINQNGGAITNLAGQTWIGESSSATWNLNSGIANLGVIHLAQTGSGSGRLNMNGGTLLVQELTTGSTAAGSQVTFNGGTVVATANNATFMHDITAVGINSGGLTIDSQANAITISQELDGGGGLTKLGNGALTLTGPNTYSGATTVSAGKLAINTAAAQQTTGAYAVGNNAELSITVPSLNTQMSMSGFAFSGAAATLDFNLGNFGNPSVGSAPVNVNGALTINGTVGVYIVDSLPQLGQFPLITYSSKSGSGNFVLASLPQGVGAYLSNNVSSLDLVITNVNLPRWQGLAGGNWDIGLTTNWINLGTGLPTYYADGNGVLLDDEATGTTTINLVTNVNPVYVTFNNTNLTYTITGNGRINGNTTVSVQGAGTVNILNTNSYTGATIISGGVLAVTNLANGGSPSAIGASSAGSTNLILNGGALSYSGAPATINRGYLTQATNSTLTIVSNLTLTGVATATANGGLIKNGPGQLTYAAAGSNTLSGVNAIGYQVQAGTVVFDGSNGGQTNLVQNDFSIIGTAGTATVILTNTTVTTTGDTSLGNSPSTAGALNLNNGSILNVGSWFTFSDSPGSTGTATMNVGSTLNVSNGRLFLCSAPGTFDTFNINGGVINKAGDYFAVVNGGWNGTGARTGIVNQVSGTINSSSEFWAGDGGGAGNLSLGVYNLSGGSLNVSNWFGVGRDGSSGIFNLTGGTINKSANGDMVFGRGGSSGKLIMTGGVINKDNNGTFNIGQGGGIGEFDQSGGVVNSTGEYWVGTDNGTIATNNISGTAQMNIHDWVTVGRAGLGVVNFSNGQFNSDTQPFVVGIFAGGVGIWNQTGGTLMVNNDIWVSQGDPTALGTINLNGGTITNTTWLAVGREGGSGVFNINGGTYVRSGLGGGSGGPNVSIAHGGGTGTVNVNSGYVDVSAGDVWVGEDSNTGTWNMNGGTAILSLINLAENASASGILNLNGGSLTAKEIATGNTSAVQRELDFNGGTLIAGADNTNFIHDLTAANVKSGGAIINTASHSVSVNQALLGVSPDGGFIKNGAGNVYLNGVNTYTNITQVNAGGLGGVGTLAGSVNVAASARLSPGAASTIGTLTVNGNLTLAASSSTLVKISMDGTPASDAVNAAASVSYNGTLVVTNTGSNPLVNGTQFQLFTTGSHTGNFANAASVTILPFGTGSFDPSTGKLTVTSAGPLTFNPVKVSGGNLILTGANGAANSGYTVLTTTNLTTPSALWTTNTTGTTDNSGNFSNAIPVSATTPARFFRVRQP